VIHGFRTIFPVPIAMAASWDPATVVTAQSIAAKEARSVGIGWAFAPMLDIARDRAGAALWKGRAKILISAQPSRLRKFADSRATTLARPIIFWRA